MSEIGKYTVNEVVERTDIAAGTLRQWERRYGVPHPERSPSGYRLYSDGDLRAIEAMKRHIADGVPASRAAELVARDAPSAGAPLPAEALRARLVDAFLRLDEQAAERALSEAHALHSVETVVAEVIAPAMVEIGDLWHDGRIETTTEHVASSFVQGWLRQLLRLAPRSIEAHPVVVACAPLDQHQLAPLMLAVLLRRAGHAVVFVGADTPIEDLSSMARSLDARAVMIAASTPPALEALEGRRELLDGIAPLLVFGGAAFDADPSRASQLGGHYLADDVGEAVQRFDDLVARARGAEA